MGEIPPLQICNAFLAEERFSPLTVAFVSIGVLVAVYMLGDWNLETLPPVAVAILIALLQFGFAPRLEKRSKKSEQELDLGQHTESLCKEVYEPLLDIFCRTKSKQPIQNRIQGAPS